MNLNETTRELSSSTGFIKHNESGIVYNYNIFLGYIDSIDNYSEATQEEWEAQEINNQLPQPSSQAETDKPIITEEQEDGQLV